MQTTTTENPRPTDALVDTFAETAGIDRDEAADRLAGIPEADLERLAETTADLFLRNAAAGHPDPLFAAHRRVGLELGRSFLAARARA